ncbi:hypothetical protein ILUMI_09506 [Ignelater luminosus]|uniref:Uncharacterized protein n=1 Tax=Ignelater luminosus TaxID=2038154 RepID=A0A8K0GFX2_IGNLU|nr:hypothetical protein ILUMI_09506 [Ignelater luminosus]
MSSDEGSTDESIKRKRPIGDAGGENIFLKSRKISRTPTKEAQSSETKLNQLLHMNIQIESKKVYKLSDKMCLIELKNLEDKATIMKNKAKLKQIKEAKVYINDDLSVTEREKQKQIRRKANEEKGNGKDVKIGYNKVIVDRVEWRWGRTKGKLEKAQSKN